MVVRSVPIALAFVALACGGSSVPVAEVERAEPDFGVGPEAPAPGTLDEQLALGAEVYQRECAGCHGPDGRGGTGPAVIGPATLPASRFHTAEDLVDFLREHMPADHPGTLADGEYLNVAAYLIGRNRMPIARPLGPGTVHDVAVAGSVPGEG